MNDWFEAEQRVERAQQLSESQRWQEALTEIDAALSIHPHHAVWHAQRGFILEELDRWEEAAAAYQTALELEPGDPDMAIALGASLSRLGRYSQALEVFEGVSKQIPDFEPAYCHRIGIYAELGQHEQAEEMFYLAQELDDACPHCFFSIGVSLLARGKNDRAIYCWKQVLTLEPDYDGVNRLIAQAYRAQGKLDVAKDYYLREVRRDPGDTDLLFELAELALESGELTIAAAKFSQILELDPDHTASHFALGKLWLLRGQPAKALACFEAIDSVTSGDVELPKFERKMGEALLELGRFAEAKEHLTIAAQEDSDSVTVWMRLGDALLAMGQSGNAADAFRRSLALEADNPLAHHKLGICLFRQARYSAGLEHCREAIRLKPDYGAAMLTAVTGQLHLAQWREARATIRQALRNDPGNPDFQQLIRRLWYYRLRYYVRQCLSVLRRAAGRASP